MRLRSIVEQEHVSVFMTVLAWTGHYPQFQVLYNMGSGGLRISFTACAVAMPNNSCAGLRGRPSTPHLRAVPFRIGAVTNMLRISLLPNAVGAFRPPFQT